MIEFAYYVISVCRERTKELRRKLIDYETTGEQRETMRGSEGRKSECADESEGEVRGRSRTRGWIDCVRGRTREDEGGERGMGGGRKYGRNREIGPSRENNDFSFVMRSACVKVRRAGFSRRDSSSGPAWLVDIFFSGRASKIDILCRSRGKGSTPSSPVAILALANKNTLNRRTSGRTRAKE